MAQCDVLERGEQLLIGDRGLDIRVTQDSPEVAEGQVRGLGEEHGLVVPIRPAQHAGGERPQPGKAAKQRGSSAA